MPGSDPLSGLPGYALRRAANAMMAELGERLAGEGLRISDATVLMLAGDGARPTASHIGKTLDIKRANMVPLLDRLEAAGLIAREPIDCKSLSITPDFADKVEIQGGAAPRTARRSIPVQPLPA